MPSFDDHKHLASIPKQNLLGFVLDKLSGFIEEDPVKFAKKAKKPELIQFILKHGTDSNIPDEKGFKIYKKPVDFLKKLYKDLPKITEEEQKAILDEPIELYKGNKRKFKPFTEGITQEEINEAMEKQIILQEHQKAFLNGFLLSGIHGAVAFHGVGTGKTLVAVAVSRLYLKLYPDNKVLFVCPPALLPNFIDGLIAFGIDPRDKRYQFFTYDGFFRSAITAENSLLIIDEAHNFRTQIPGFQLGEDEEGFQPVGSVKSYEMIQRGALTAHKALCLTGTVMVNKIYDIANLLAIANGTAPESPDAFQKIVRDERNRYDYFKNRVSMYFNEIDYKTGKPSPPNPNFPEMREKYVPIVSNSEKILARADAKSNPVYTASRQASMVDEKIDYCIKIIDDEPTKKFVIYTAFKDNVSKVGRKLKAKGIDYGVISGAENAKEKKAAIESYNEFYKKSYTGEKVRVLIITKAGAEGVNLIETRGIFIIDGVWNEALSIQIIARAIRFRSHANLPEKDRYVNVYKLFVCAPQEKKLIESLNSKDGVKFNFNKYIEKVKEDRKKEKEINSRKGKDYTGRSKIDDSLILEYAQKENVENFDNELYESLKPKEKKEYIAKFGTFMKDREKYLAKELASIAEGTPSTDFYLFALQKSKEKIIIEFIKAIARIPDVEDAFSTQEVGKMAKNFIEKWVKTGATERQIASLLIKKLRPNLTKANELIAKSSEKMAEKLKKIIDEGFQRDKLIAEKTRNRLKQEFFTPTHIVKELIDFSGIVKDSRIMPEGFQCLEPTAGYGAIVRGLLKLMSQEKPIDVRIDMVEIIDENRRVLEQLVKDVPMLLNLMEQPDFLRFTPNKAYDYIFMNPPFHLVKEGKYDFDFVQRAFGMLKPGGKLVAITGIKYKEFPEAVKFYKDTGAVIRLRTVEWKENDPNEKLKNLGMEIQNLKIAFIMIEKAEIDDPNKNWSIAEDAKLKEIAPEVDKPNTVKEVAQNIEDNVDLQFNLIKSLAEPINDKISKGKLSKNEGAKELLDSIMGMEFKADAFSDKVSDKLAKKESKEAEKQIALANFTEPKKRGRKPKVGDPELKPKPKKLTKKQLDEIKSILNEADKIFEISSERRPGELNRPIEAIIKRIEKYTTDFIKGGEYMDDDLISAYNALKKLIPEKKETKKLTKKQLERVKQLNTFDMEKEIDDLNKQIIETRRGSVRRDELIKKRDEVDDEVYRRLRKLYEDKIMMNDDNYEFLNREQKLRRFKDMRDKEMKELTGGSFWSDFKKGFKQGFMGTLDVAKTILPFVV